MRPTLASCPALCFASVLLAAAALHAAPAPVAVLPSVGTASEGDRRDLDGALREALLDEDRVDLLSPVETRAHVMSLAELGLVCLPEDTTCLVKLGTVAHVAYLLVPVGNTPADPQKAGGKVLDVEMGVIDVQHERRVRLVKASFDPNDEEQAVAIVDRALDLTPKQQPGTTGAASTTSTTPPHPGLDDGAREGPPPAAPDETPLSLGTVVTATSGVVGASALLGAVACDLVYADILPLADAKTRKDLVQPAGAALWVTTGLAAAGVGAGLYLLLGPPASEP